MRTILDCHLHSDFSPDSSESAENLVLAAIDKGLKHIAITDHTDLKHPEGYIGVDGSVMERYTERLYSLKRKYRDKIYLAVGLEAGFLPAAQMQTAALLASAPLEYVINSVHCVAGTDCYAPGHFDGLCKREAYLQYLSDVLKSLNAPYRYDTLGHLGYIARVAPYEDRNMSFKEFSSELGTVFEKLIAGGIILELNTSLSKAPGISIPHPELVKIYYDMGGRLVTLGSDAHGVNRIADGFEPVQKELKRIGFKYLTAKQDGEPVQFAL